MMRVLVTGAAGFLAKALLDRFAESPRCDVLAVDLTPSTSRAVRTCDLRDAEAVRLLVQETQPEQVYHLAGTLSNDFETDFVGNVLTTRNLLEAVRLASPAPRVLLVGSAAEYGCVRIGDNPVGEQQSLEPVSIYGWSKVCQTHLMGFYRRVHGIDVVMARVFNLQGPDASSTLFVGRVYEQVERFKRGEIEAITVGSLEAVRDYLPVAEAAHILECIMTRGASGEVYHVASGQAISTREVLYHILAEEGIPRDAVRSILRLAPDKIDAPAIYADITKTKSLLRGSGS